MNFKRTVVFVIVLGMMAGTFSYNGTAGYSIRTDRHQVILVNNITVVHNQNEVVDGIYRNGNFRLNLLFGLTKAVSSVSVTWNVTHIDTGISEIFAVPMGNLTAGNHISLDPHFFNFGTTGEYLVNATVCGNHNNSNVSSSLVEIFHFANQARYDLHFEISEGLQAETGEYASRSPLTISGDVTNKGNYDIWTTIINITIMGSGGPEEVNRPWNNPFGLLMINGTIEGVEFNWHPSTEGVFFVNVSVTDPRTNCSNSTGFSVSVQNVSIIRIWDIQFDPVVNFNQGFNVRVQLNNTGNIAENTTVTLKILDSNDNVVYFNESITKEIPASESSNFKHDITNISIDTGGLYEVNVTISTGSSVEKSIIIGSYDPPPQLYNPLVEPNPMVEDVYENEVVTFFVTCSHFNNEAAGVQLDIDGEKFNMTPADGVGDTWVDGEQFKCEWTSTEGVHNFSFVCTDGMDNVTLEPADHDFTILPPCTGILYGKVTDERGANIPNVDIILYSTVINETNVTQRDKYYNLTTDENGSYMKELPFTDFKYVLYVDIGWMHENDYGNPDPAITNFRINPGNRVVWKNFSLGHPDYKWPARINGTVTDEAGKKMSGVKITVEIVRDEVGDMTVVKRINGTLENASINVTIRTWMNISITTGTDGSYCIMGVPINAPEGLDVTGTKIYRHDLGEMPRKNSVCWWYVNAEKKDYEIKETLLRFKEKRTTFWNVTMNPLVIKRYTVSGKTDPHFARIESDIYLDYLVEVKWDNNTGIYTIMNVESGQYTLTFTSDGYEPYVIDITVVDSNLYLGKISLILLPSPLHTVKIGPFIDGDGDGFPGITISFTMNRIHYSNVTGSDGYAIFEITGSTQIPYNTEITIDKDGKTKKYYWPDVKYGEDEGDPVSAGNGDSNTLVILLIIVIVIVLIASGIYLWMVMFRKKEPEIPYETNTCDHACPYCAAPVPSQYTYCPFCREDFNCIQCGYPIALGAPVCHSCGMELRKRSRSVGDEHKGVYEKRPIRSVTRFRKIKKKTEDPR